MVTDYYLCITHKCPFFQLILIYFQVLDMIVHSSDFLDLNCKSITGQKYFVSFLLHIASRYIILIIAILVMEEGNYYVVIKWFILTIWGIWGHYWQIRDILIVIRWFRLNPLYCSWSTNNPAPPYYCLFFCFKQVRKDV